jgi:hypothetical protein
LEKFLEKKLLAENNREHQHLLVANLGCAGSFWIFAAVCVGAVAFVGLLVPETRGRTLEQIQSSFT